MNLDDPCPHPARMGKHELYTDANRLFCRSCGASSPKMKLVEDAATQLEEAREEIRRLRKELTNFELGDIRRPSTPIW